MMSNEEFLTVEVMYHHIDRIGLVPQLGQSFPCDEAASGSLLVMEKSPLMQAGRRVGWTIRGRR